MLDPYGNSGRQRIKCDYKKAKKRKIQQKNYPGSVAFYNTRPGNKMGLFYNALEPTRGSHKVLHRHSLD